MTTEAPTRNRELFYKIAQDIEDEPKRYFQGWWGSAIFPEDVVEGLVGYKVDDRLYLHGVDQLDGEEYGELPEPCGTAFCIAGHAMVNSGWKAEWDTDHWLGARILWTAPEGHKSTSPNFNMDGRKALGITYDEAERLFDSGWLPPEGMTVPEALRAIGDGAPITRY